MKLEITPHEYISRFSMGSVSKHKKRHKKEEELISNIPGE
jgi:hypothetical protein